MISKEPKHPRKRALYARTRIKKAAKEPCIFWKESYILSKEPCILSKELNILSKEPKFAPKRTQSATYSTIRVAKEP